MFLNLIKVYCDPGNLVFVLGTNSEEETYMISELQKQNIAHLPKIISADNSINERYVNDEAQKYCLHEEIICLKTVIGIKNLLFF